MMFIVKCNVIMLAFRRDSQDIERLCPCYCQNKGAYLLTKNPKCPLKPKLRQRYKKYNNFIVPLSSSNVRK